MKDLATLVRELQDNGEFDRLRIDPLAQFGTEDNPFLFASILPEVNRDTNQYTETQIRYQTILANSGSSYSPAQLNPGGQIVGEFDVKFGNINQADQMTVQDYEAIMKLLMQSGTNSNADMEAMARVLQFMNKQILWPVLTLNEKQRTDAVIDAQVLRTGSNGYSELVTYPNPTGHRVNIPGGTAGDPAGWYETDGSYDPFSDFFAAQKFLAAKGYRVNRIISCFDPAYTFMKNTAVATRMGGISITQAGALGRVVPTVSRDRINAELQANGLPPWEIYDRTYNYRTTTGNISFARYLERADYYPVILLCTTGRDEVIDLGDRSTVSNVIQLQNTLGYFGIGRVAGKPNTGRWMWSRVEEKHPGGMYGECVQEGLPVITEPEAIFVLKVYKPTP